MINNEIQKQMWGSDFELYEINLNCLCVQKLLSYMIPAAKGESSLQHPNVYYSPTKLQNINCILAKTQGEGALYIGDAVSTLKSQYLVENRIEAVLRCNKEASTQMADTGFHIEFRMIDTGDKADYPIKMHFDGSFEFIQKMRCQQKKNVLVQCHGGVSRSATIVCAYLIKKKDWSPEQALSYLKIRRPRVKPNEGFFNQLQEYYNELKGIKPQKKKEQKRQMLFQTPKKKEIPQIFHNRNLHWTSSPQLKVPIMNSPSSHQFTPKNEYNRFLSPKSPSNLIVYGQSPTNNSKTGVRNNFKPAYLPNYNENRQMHGRNLSSFTGNPQVTEQRMRYVLSGAKNDVPPRFHDINK